MFAHQKPTRYNGAVSLEMVFQVIFDLICLEFVSGLKPFDPIEGTETRITDHSI